MKTTTTLIAVFAAFIANSVYAAPTVPNAALVRRDDFFDVLDEMTDAFKDRMADLGKTGTTNFEYDLNNAEQDLHRRLFDDDEEDEEGRPLKAALNAVGETIVEAVSHERRDIGVGSLPGQLVTNTGRDVFALERVASGVARAATGSDE